MKRSHRVGFSFGLTSGIITTLGLMVGLNAGTHSRMVVIGGILTIAIADAMSDALGIHVSEESEQKHSEKEVWQSTISTFVTKFFFALTFMVPILLFDLSVAIIIGVLWGLLCLVGLNYFIAKKGEKLKVIIEHLLIAVLVIILTQLVGKGVALMAS